MKDRFSGTRWLGLCMDNKSKRLITKDDLFYILKYLRQEERSCAKKILRSSMYDPVKPLKFSINGKRYSVFYNKNEKMICNQIPNWETSYESIVTASGPNFLAVTLAETVILPREMLLAYIKTSNRQRKLISK